MIIHKGYHIYVRFSLRQIADDTAAQSKK